MKQNKRLPEVSSNERRTELVRGLQPPSSQRENMHDSSKLISALAAPSHINSRQLCSSSSNSWPHMPWQILQPDLTPVVLPRLTDSKRINLLPTNRQTWQYTPAKKRGDELPFECFPDALNLKPATVIWAGEVDVYSGPDSHVNVASDCLQSLCSYRQSRSFFCCTETVSLMWLLQHLLGFQTHFKAKMGQTWYMQYYLSPRLWDPYNFITLRNFDRW